jgi:hypothetical protein
MTELYHTVVVPDVVDCERTNHLWPALLFACDLRCDRSNFKKDGGAVLGELPRRSSEGETTAESGEVRACAQPLDDARSSNRDTLPFAGQNSYVILLFGGHSVLIDCPGNRKLTTTLDRLIGKKLP